MVGTFSLADIYDVLRGAIAPGLWSSLGHMSPSGREALASLNFGLLRRLQGAHEDREALLAEVRRISCENVGYSRACPPRSAVGVDA